MPTNSDMRAPASTRAKVSRPSSSSPNQCVSEGPSRRLARSCTAGSNRAKAGPISAATIAMSTMVAPTLLIANARIDEPVEEIRQQIHPDVGDGNQQNAPLNQRIVAEPDRLNQQSPDAGPRENRFRDDRAGQHGTELQPDQGNNRNQTVSERVTEDRPRTRRTAGTCGGHVLLA